MLRIELDDAELRSELARLRARLGDLTPAMRRIGELLVERTKARFREGKGPDGKSWPPNSPATIEAFVGRYYGGAVPRKRDGTLAARARRLASAKRPLIGESRRLSSEIAYAIGHDHVEVGSNLVYAAAQQFGARKGQFGTTRRGTPIPWGEIPARPFLGLSPRDRDDILALLRAHISP